jgi:hypothetical protein
VRRKCGLIPLTSPARRVRPLTWRANAHPNVSERQLASYPVYNLELAGWRRQSTWGWDPAQQSYYAQLTPDTSTREAEWQGPEIWVSPPRYPAIPDPAALAEAIAQAAGVPLAVARQAMNDSLAEGDPLRQPAR